LSLIQASLFLNTLSSFIGCVLVMPFWGLG
jgi:hypothetical protein